MELSWIHRTDKNYLELQITENLHYIAYAGGRKIKKFVDDELVDVFVRMENDDPWEEEKQWLSQFYKDIVGTYKPMWDYDPGQQHGWKVSKGWNQEFPVFGISRKGEYLDRLQRPTSKQIGKDMTTVLKNDEFHMMIEKDDDGNHWQRPWCTEQDTFYNVQPCCVFPENPGRKLIPHDEAIRLIEKYGYAQK